MRGMSPADVLVVEDEPTIAEIVCRYLARAGYTARTASDGLAAVAAVSSRRPDLIVLDIMLPGIDGLEVMRRVRADTELPIAIILLTAKGDEHDRIAGCASAPTTTSPSPSPPPSSSRASTPSYAAPSRATRANRRS